MRLSLYLDFKKATLQKASLTYTITHVPPQVVYNCLLDFREFGGLHPYMVTVEHLRKLGPGCTEYKVNERIKFARLFPYSPQYNVAVTEVENGRHVTYTSNVKWNINLRIDFHLAGGPANTTHITEHIAIAGNRLLAAVFMRILKRAHRKTMLTLQETMKI